ncbi:MAG: tRNA (guanine-N1)-methyltransferase [Cyanobacteriota bacterium]|nr:tRNA (guanine-N1)-methyltransferase [Cyanobacteriota bacterium]
MNDLLGDRVKTEGRVKFEVGRAFYNPESQIVRDLGVLAAGVYRRDRSQLRVLDAMAGCGARSLRYWVESEADWVLANEGNPELGEILRSYLAEAIAAGQGQITHQNAHRLFCQCYSDRDYYDLIDIDSFGSPTPYLSLALRAAKIDGLLYLTNTDGRTTTGHLPDNSLKVYGAYARAHPAAREQGLRLIIGAAQQQAASIGLGIQPIFALFWGQSDRVMVRLLPKPVLSSQNYGFLGYCHRCGEYRVVSWRKLGRTPCPTDDAPLTLTGPMWLGELHDRAELSKMSAIARDWNWRKPLKLLANMDAEIEFPPYFYTLSEIGRRGKIDIPKRSRLLQALQQQGYRACAASLHPSAIKTDAELATCIAIAQRRS